MAYTQPNSPFKQTTNGNINITSKILTKAEAAQAKQEERDEVKKNKEKNTYINGRVVIPFTGEKAKRVTIPFTGEKAKRVKL